MLKRRVHLLLKLEETKLAMIQTGHYLPRPKEEEDKPDKEPQSQGQGEPHSEAPSDGDVTPTAEEDTAEQS